MSFRKEVNTSCSPGVCGTRIQPVLKWYNVREILPDEQVFKTLSMTTDRQPSIFSAKCLCQVVVIYGGQPRQMSNCVVGSKLPVHSGQAAICYRSLSALANFLYFPEVITFTPVSQQRSSNRCPVYRSCHRILWQAWTFYMMKLQCSVPQ
jgi:hypothetical protein